MKLTFVEPIHLQLLANVKGKYETNKKQAIFYCCALLLALMSSGVCALESDSDQPINIDSNTATYDDATATSTYIGNVISVQGSIRVIRISCGLFCGRDAEKLVFTGNKAKFKQTPSEGGEDITVKR